MPIVTDLRMAGGSEAIDGGAMLIARALAQAANPSPATIIEHGRHGRMYEIDIESFARTTIRNARVAA